MSTFKKHFTLAAVTILVFFGSIRFATAGVIERTHKSECSNLPVVKNMTGLVGQHVCDWMAAPKKMTKGEAKRLAVTAETREDHLTVARFYRAEANGLDEQAAGYELAAAGLRDTPIAKNLAAPSTAGQFEFAAKGFREEAGTDRAIAATHEKIAAGVIALLQ